MIERKPSCATLTGLTRADFLLGSAGAFCTLALGHRAWGQAMGEKMQTRPIPSTGASLPVIGCGTWRTFDVGNTPQERDRLGEVLRVLFESGGSVIDSSPMYGRAEGVVGDLLSAAHSRDNAFIATKVWTSGKSAGIAQMQRSMQLLRTDHIDLMQVHNLLDWRTHLATLRGWKQEGRINNYAIDDRAAEKRLLPLAVDRGIAILVNQPFGGGGLLRTLAGRPLPDWAADIDCRILHI